MAAYDAEAADAGLTVLDHLYWNEAEAVLAAAVSRRRAGAA